MIEQQTPEAQEFKSLKLEVEEAIEAQDDLTARVALGEIECIWMHTEWPNLREATAAFLRRNAGHADFIRFVA